MSSYNLCTGFPPKLWKTPAKTAVLLTVSVFLCVALLSSCSFFRSSKKESKPGPENKTVQEGTAAEAGNKPKDKPKAAKAPNKKKVALDSRLIDQNEDMVKQKFGEPDIVSKTADSQIIWTYKPKYKLWPDNADIVFVEFENGKVTKIVRTTK